ncbi:MAG: nucleotidyltransferase domain-containing protein [Nanoarchaeota archaeon]
MKDILSKQLEIIKPSAEEKQEINKIGLEFAKDLQWKLKKRKIKAEVFIGGSLAKGTLIKKDNYDIDMFVRFENEKDILKLGSLLKKAKVVHGSRDYYHFNINGVLIEVVPVLKIKKPEQAQNVTDLSYFHVNYVLKKIKKDKKIIEGIMLAKSFCRAQNCYGAESYVNGFSGYALELLICHYGSFENFLRQVVKCNSKDKIIIDDTGFYKGRNILIELNESKINSPIILIDPTFKERNACAGLSDNTFEKFKKSCEEFLKKPSTNFFVIKDIKEELEKKYGKELNIIEVKTNKQMGDIAGTKSKKFLGFFLSKLKKEFNIKESGFNYDEKKNIAEFYLIVEKKKDEVIRGPPISALENLKYFKKAHSNAFIKGKYAYATIKHNLSFKDFFRKFKEKDKKIIREMSVKEMKLI